MGIILIVFAVLEFFGGIGVFAGAKSAIHEILGTLAIGFSIMTLGLAGILNETGRSRALLEKQVAEAQKRLEEQRAALSPHVEPTTYRGYSYSFRENGVDLTLQHGGTRHFPSEEELVAYIDAIKGKA